MRLQRRVAHWLEHRTRLSVGSSLNGLSLRQASPVEVQIRKLGKDNAEGELSIATVPDNGGVTVSDAIKRGN